MATYNDSQDSTPESGYSSFLDKVYKSRLTPAEDGCWKIIFTNNYYSEGTEVIFSEEEIAEISNWSRFKLIPVKNNRWKISIESTSDIIRRKKGKFDIMIHSDLLLVTIRKDGCWSFYCPSSEEYDDSEHETEHISNRKISYDYDDDFTTSFDDEDMYQGDI